MSVYLRNFLTVKAMKNFGKSGHGRSQRVPKNRKNFGALRGHLCDSTAFLLTFPLRFCVTLGLSARISWVLTTRTASQPWRHLDDILSGFDLSIAIAVITSPATHGFIPVSPFFVLSKHIPANVKMVRGLNVVKAGGAGAQKEKKKPNAVHAPGDKVRDTPTCSECDVAISKNVKALQCDMCSSSDSWKCIDCLDIRSPLYESLIDGQGKELRWFCKSCDASVMKHSWEIGWDCEYVESKTDSIETALIEKVDRTSLDDFSVKLSNVESAVDKLTHTCGFEERTQQVSRRHQAQQRQAGWHVSVQNRREGGKFGNYGQ